MSDEYLKKLVIARLNAIPPDVSFSIGGHGDFTRNQLIEEVEKGSEIGQTATRMELNFLRKMAKLSQMME